MFQALSELQRHDIEYKKKLREVANMIAFLLSDLASFTTGAYIPVSGGRVMPAI